ncbi:phenylalanine--tRNA ligase subunit beta [Parvimonas micra]|uniref:Phenylalanine--tRNA ligase beta subunit n=1 Tax=Parvimonas micra TaxID=33033 RepID=A0A930H5W5_9FIRM|nr:MULTISPECIES: phenylalanine--tRNA ligase subunit beta [Parvimonas]MBF1275813.1 phenylalanine--tRNA ligase subunit beta [Parvimonas micra]MBF1307779.1 phenylalanine--tRNA ligase subunit beta [Parvimonas micra]MEB3058065.1 phenylalanine--tRNA ligase subunit beta [Parvimonas sp. D9]MEB3059687.1 phenylalanine--tRNA ligase subunit beta [Parvimonas micra]MEB3066018.1 phenylalanine--tRNA ligase subunit beta [Parvimonas micra]
MLLPIKWAKEYVDINDDIMNICDKVTLTGSHVESIIKLGDNIDNIVVGKIIDIYRHENSNKLWITKVDLGNEIVQIVTAAQNLKQFDYVPVAKVNSTLSDNTKIKEAKLAGEISQGMFCSYKELGYPDSVIPKEYKDGVLRIIDENTVLGTDIREVLDLDDTVVEFEITPNRPDCLSIVGMAREIAASFDKKLNPINVKNLKEIENKSLLNITIHSDDCKRYSASIVKDVTIKESARKVQNYLLNSGIRPVNNIVDLTNFLMLELGQPLHAFDLDKLEGNISIRNAFEGEKVVTLDDVERTLSSEDMLICDDVKPIAIAGVMGLKNSEIDENTKNIFIESAFFTKKTIKSTSKRLGLKSEASIRYEKGLTSEHTMNVLARFLCLLEKNVKCKIDSIFDVNKEETTSKLIEFDTNLVKRLLGVEIKNSDIITYLDLLEIKTEVKGDVIICTIPYFRTDLVIQEDIVEEIGRLYGFCNLNPTPILAPNTIGRKSKKRILEDKIKNILLNLGLYEITTYSFIGGSIIKKSKMNTQNTVKILNPLGEEFSIMRKSLIPNIIEVLSKNLNYKNEDLLVYELGNTFHTVENYEVPLEKKRLVIGSYGKYDFYYIKDVIINLFNVLNIKNIEFIKNNCIDYFHPGVCADILANGEKVGEIGQISYDVCKNFSIKKNIFVCEIDIEKIRDKVSLIKIYEPIIKYPAVKRDLAIIVDKDIDSGRIEKIFKNNSNNLLKNIELFDIYTGNQINKGKKSMAYKLTFQSKEKTLVDEDINSLIDNMLFDLKEQLGAYLRF